MRTSANRRHNHPLLATLATTLVTAASGCDNGGTPPPTDPTWTIFVYGHADHNLSASLVTDMAEMSRATLDDRVRVIVMADWDASRERDGGGNYPGGTEWFQIVGGNAEAMRLGEAEAEQDLDDPAVLRASIRRAFEEHPADRYGLVLWDHGGAWDGGFGQDGQDGMNSEPDGMRIDEVGAAVRGALDDVGLDGPRPLVFLAFDTCLLGGAEIVHDLAELSEIFIANAEIDYGDGWDYQAMLTYISQNRDVDAFELGAHEAEVWDAHHASATVSDRLLRSHIVIDTAEVEALEDAIRALSDVLLSSDRWLDLAVMSFRAQPPYGGGVDRRFDSLKYRDLGLLARRLARSEDMAVAEAADGVLRALASARVGGSEGTMRRAAGQMGLHISLPLPLDISNEMLAEYRDRADGFRTRTRWDEVLQDLGAARDETGPTARVTAENGADGVDISVQVDDEDVARIELFAAVADADQPGNYLAHGLFAAAAIDPRRSYPFRWDRTVATLADMETVSVRQWVDGGATADDDPLPSLLAINGILVVGDERTPSALVYEAESGTADVLVVGAGTDSPQSYTLSAASAEYPAEARFVAQVRSEGSAGRVSYDNPGVPLPEMSGLSVGRRTVDAGAYVIGVQATDVWGNESFAGVRITAP